MENRRITENNKGEIPEGDVLQFKISTKTPNESLAKVKEVISLVAKYSVDNWPTDEVWGDLLPAWFVKRIKSNSIGELRKNPSLWHFKSWLDALKYRGWEWFSSKVYCLEYLILLEAVDYPYSVNPLEYVIMESGVEMSNIEFTTH